jgi:hypothetical protein
VEGKQPRTEKGPTESKNHFLNGPFEKMAFCPHIPGLRQSRGMDYENFKLNF